jgi:hypothetical protein
VLIEEDGHSAEDGADGSNNLLPFLLREFLGKEGGREGGRAGGRVGKREG